MIQIRQKCRPYIHEFGASCPIPNTKYSLQVWPTKMRIYSDEQSFNYNLECSGPVENFTLMLDLEKGQIYWFFKAQEGFISWVIRAQNSGIVFTLKRVCNAGVVFNNNRMHRGHSFFQELGVVSTTFTSNERLCFGIHKEQQIDKVFVRGELKELLGLYFRFGQYFKDAEPLSSLDLLFKTHACQLHSLFSLKQSEHDLLGIEHSAMGQDFFAKSYKWIRNAFFQESGARLMFMPNMKLFNAGRLCDLKFSLGKLSFIFRKKRVLRIVIDAIDDGDFYLSLPQKCNTMRVRRSLRAKGSIHSINDAIQIRKSSRLYLDKFYF